MRALIFAALALIAAPFATAAEFRLDIAELRQLAESMPGDKPSEIRVERVGQFDYPWAAVIDGGEKENVAMAVFAFQLAFPDRTALIDVAFGKAVGDSMGGVTGWDDAASARIDAAMAKADFIVVTHEHADHIGSIVAQAADKALMARTRLTTEQIAEPAYMQPLTWPAGALDGYRALDYDRVTAIAPGVVLIEAPGHTPGSQLVFVKTAGGAEYLFLGDTAWQMRNVAEMKNRPAATVKEMNEDNAAVMAQLAAFNGLTAAEPGIVIVPGHDAGVVERLIGDGKLIAAFKD